MNLRRWREGGERETRGILAIYRFGHSYLATGLPMFPL